MKIAIIIIVALIIVAYFIFKNSTNALVKDTSRPSPNLKPSAEVTNDKVIMVTGVNHTDITKALNDLCNLYNKTDYAALPRLYQLSEKEFAVTFPYNSDMSIFCFAVNYLKYPIDIKWQAEVHGWATLSTTDNVSDPDLAGKLCMFYTVDDKEYDNVYLTSADNFSSKVPFTDLEPKALSTIVEVFKNKPLKLASLNNAVYENFE